MPIRVIVVAAHELSADAFRALFTQSPEVTVVSTATTRAEAIALATQAQPDVAVIIILRGDGLGVVGELALLTKVIVVGARDEVEARSALAAGARGVVAARQTSAELFAAIGAVARGETSVPSWPDGPAASSWRDGPAPAANGSASPLPAGHPLAPLTPRERQVFERLIQGDTNPIIARRLGISPKTVDTHRMHVMRKLGVHSVVQLVRFAARHQLLPPDAQSALA